MFKFFTKNKDLQAAKKTLKLLSSYHAMPIDNPQFTKQYRHLIELIKILQK